MPDPKLIYRERLQQDEVEKTRLSYEDLFQVKTDEEVDYQEVLERNNLEWTRRVNETRQLAIKEGYDAGLTDGETQARKRIDEQLHHFEAALMEIDRRLHQTIEEIKPGIVSLVFDMAEKVIGVPVENDSLKTWVVDTVRTTLETITDHSKIKITVAEADYDAVKELMEKLPEFKKVTVTYTGRLNPGEFEIDSPHHAVLNSFSKKLDDLRAAAPLNDWGKKK
ncbi:hypothetical protein EP331_08470 [bacterium]|nr:MAG: hypothetical protein EP331_08470 [bacterium]